MLNNLTLLKMRTIFTSFILFSVFTVYAQDTATIGNKLRSGTSNSSFAVIRGQQIGIKMKAGHKLVKLLRLNFDAENRSSDSLKFKVNVYEFNNALPGENLVTQTITGSMPKGKHLINVDLSPYDIKVKGSILVSIEWLETKQVAEPVFSIGLFNGGTWQNENDKWKKVPVAGVDFNVLVEKLKKQ